MGRTESDVRIKRECMNGAIVVKNGHEHDDKQTKLLKLELILTNHRIVLGSLGKQFIIGGQH